MKYIFCFCLTLGGPYTSKVSLYAADCESPSVFLSMAKSYIFIFTYIFIFIFTYIYIHYIHIHTVHKSKTTLTKDPVNGNSKAKNFQVECMKKWIELLFRLQLRHTVYNEMQSLMDKQRTNRKVILQSIIGVINFYE